MIIKNRLNNNFFMISIFFVILFLVNISLKYSNYLDLKYNEIYQTNVTVINIYKKNNYNILKLQSSDFFFYTKVSKDEIFKKLDLLDITFITKEIDFISYLKGFFAQNLYFYHVKKDTTFKDIIYNKITNSHDLEDLKEFYLAIFLGLPVNDKLREIFTNYSISHLIALSGFHLSVLSFIFYFLIFYPYKVIHQTFFPYRNKRYDILVITFIFLFTYLYFTGFIPSLTRAFIMLIIAFYILRFNIKLISYKVLIFTLLFAICLFPNFIFSLGFWFSISAVFYIFLYIQYFKSFNMIFNLIFFNFWIFLVFNPIVHYFFPQTTYEQLLSPFISIAFTIFYPLVIFLHIINQGYLLDTYIIDFFNIKQTVFLKETSVIFLLFFICISFLSTIKTTYFYFLNILVIFYSFYLYLV